jgi:hypothetical protein
MPRGLTRLPAAEAVGFSPALRKSERQLDEDDILQYPLPTPLMKTKGYRTIVRKFGQQ